MKQNKRVKCLKCLFKSRVYYRDLHHFVDLEYLYIDIFFITTLFNKEYLDIIKSIEVGQLLKSIYLNFLLPFSITEEIIDEIINNIKVPFGCEINISCPIFHEKIYLVKIHNKECEYTTVGKRKLERIYNVKTFKLDEDECIIICNTDEEFILALKKVQ